MKVRLKKAVQSNAAIDEFTNKVLQSSVDDLPAVLSGFKWVYDKVRLISTFAPSTFEEAFIDMQRPGDAPVKLPTEASEDMC